jgi:hypothetical protein
MLTTPIGKFVAAIRHIAAYLGGLAEAVALIRKFVVALGFGLVLSSLRLDPVRVGNIANYSKDGTTYVFLIALVVVAAGFLLANVMLEGERFLGVVSGIGAVLLGFFAFIPLGYSTHLGSLGNGSWFGLGGSLLIALGAAPSGLFSLSKNESRSGRAICVSRLVGALGLGLVMVSLPLALTAGVVSDDLGHLHHPSFWNSAGLFYGLHGNHALGIAMIVLAALALACLVAASLIWVRLFEAWAVASSLVLLGIASYAPVRLAFNYLVGLHSGAGLGLEGALVAAGATTAALLARRGVLELNRSSVRALLAIVGLGLALAADGWTEVFSVKPGNFWVDGTLGGFPLILIAAAAALVVAGFVLKRWWILPAISALGWVILGFFAFDLAQVAPTFGNLGPATWLGVAGGVVIGLSAISPRVLSYWRPRPIELTAKNAAASLAAGAGLGLVVWSLWLDAEPMVGTLHRSYWDVGNNDHSLGIVMLVLAVSALAALVGAVGTRIPLLAEWTLAASLVLVGIAVYQPAFEAFNNLGNFRPGTWLALAGSLLASAGAVAVIRLEEPLESSKPEEVVVSRPVSTRPKGRKTATSRVPGTRTKK